MFTNHSKKSNTALISFNKCFANGSSWSTIRAKDCKMLLCHAVYSIFSWKYSCVLKRQNCGWKEYKNHMTTISVCKEYFFVYVMENSATTYLLTYAEEQDKTKNLKQNADLTCKFTAFISNNVFSKLLIKKKISDLLARINMQYNLFLPDPLLNMFSPHLVFYLSSNGT